MPKSSENGSTAIEVAPATASDEGENTQELICTILLGSLEETIDALRAADTLGLGARAHNCWRAEKEDVLVGEWWIDLFVEALHVEH